MTLTADSLPPPSSYSRRHDATFVESTRGEFPLRHGRTLDDELVQVAYSLAWVDKPRGVAEAIWQHYVTHGIGAFDWTIPNGATIKVRWASPPQFTHTSPTTASVTGELEQLLAYS